MKTRVYFWMASLFVVLVCLCSCEKEEEWVKMDNKVTKVKYKLHSNTDAPIFVYGLIEPEDEFIVWHEWEKSYETTEYVVSMAACSANPEAHLIGEIYVGRKLVQRVEDDGLLDMSAWVKGDNMKYNYIQPDFRN